VVAPELAERFPFIRTYNGRGIDDPTATIRFDLGRSGFHAQVLTPRGNWYIDPYYHQDQSAYVSYFGRDLTNTHGRLFDHEDPAGEGGPAASALDAERVVGTELRTYRLALATTGEYATFHGGTVPLVHNELVVAVNRVTGVYERELAIRLQLVANNDSLINLNASTDPYTNGNAGALLNQNQSNVDSVIGSANYDIGHVFSTGGGGLASLAVVGKAGQKARGETGLPNPVGDAFYIDYVAHEMGHQFGANHPFNGVNGSCNGNAVSSVAMEPGSGSTIMAYAGICGTDDLQPHSDDYFHAVSFDEIAAYTTTPGSPGNLGASPSGNTAPTVTPAGTSFTIPVRTPFALSATGSDADPDTLTYTWEQFDGGALRALNAVSKPTGALFRSFGPTTSSTRVFPTLSSILANTTNANSGTCPALSGGLNCWSEFLPTVARTMNFRVSVRDNNPAAGGVNSANTVVTSSGTAPFLVTAPNTAVSLPGGTSTTVTWNVAATNVAPINTANVNILLSTDGGNTFPTTLVAGTPNDGSQAVTLPTASSTQARVKVEASGNIFFDVSDANFTITAGGGTVDVFPSSFTIEVGTAGGGTATNLNADDNSYLVVRSTRTATKTATWYGTFQGVDNAVSSLDATYKGKSSFTCTQLVSIFRWTDSSWVQLDSRSVGTTEIEIAGLSPSGTPADFVSNTSGTGDVRIRVSCSTASGAFNLSGDLMKLSVGTGGAGTQTLTVTTTGTGAGTVTSSPPGIDCGVDCSEAYTTGTVVTLTATPGGSSTFTGWSGACTGTGVCQVTMNAATSATATFTGTGGTHRLVPIIVHGRGRRVRQRDRRELERRRRRLPGRSIHARHEDRDVVRHVQRGQQHGCLAHRDLQREVVAHLHAGGLDLPLDRFHVGPARFDGGRDHRGRGVGTDAVGHPRRLRERHERHRRRPDPGELLRGHERLHAEWGSHEAHCRLARMCFRVGVGIF
jgi:hypothetical protein